MTRLAIAAVLCAVLAAGAASSARADSVPYADDGALPWANGAASTSPLETLAARIATTISGRPVTVRCNGENDWGILVGDRGVDQSVHLGYVTFWIRTLNGVQVGAPFAGDFTELSPTVCSRLNTFALASSKPTRCAVTRTVTTETTKAKRVAVRTPKRVKIRRNGKLVTVTRIVTTWKTTQVTTTTHVKETDPAASCYAGGRAAAEMPAPYWDDYWWYARSMLTLAHESIHLGNDQSEINASCYGLQWVRYVAEQLGAAPDDAQAIASYAWDQVYPAYKNVPGYWSADCRDGGSLDLHPGSNVWP
jgi:hypothetical protein